MIYLDHAATTPLAPEVLDAMMPYLTTEYGNPSSLHHVGRRARRAVEDAREQIAAAIGARPGQLIFTSGGSESDSTAVLGFARARADRGRHVITTQIEHHAVLHACDELAREGFELTHLAPDQEGRIDPGQVADALRDDTVLVAVMHANNEIGTIQPIARIAELCYEHGVPCHTDAVQSLGQLPLDVGHLGVSSLAASAHKLYGPRGVGLLYLRPGPRPRPLIFGGSQERNRRAGTENVAGIVGFAAAVRLWQREANDYAAHCQQLRDRLIDGLLKLPGTSLNGAREGRLPNNVNVSFAQILGENLLILLDQLDIAVSTGSACSSGATDPSHVLLALGQGRDLAHGSLRLTVGRSNTAEQVDLVLDELGKGLARLRELVPKGN